ncbi:hypothetical protein TH67_10045 [Campylobacter concisus]|nr:hypothetical protein TH67_10045 [Campylobacter concisus]
MNGNALIERVLPAQSHATPADRLGFRTRRAPSSPRRDGDGDNGNGEPRESGRGDAGEAEG